MTASSPVTAFSVAGAARCGQGWHARVAFLQGWREARRPQELCQGAAGSRAAGAQARAAAPEALAPAAFPPPWRKQGM
jgi:hypothetical protein